MKKRNSLVIILVISTFAFCQKIISRTETMDKVKKIHIESVNFSIMTIISVECNKFEEYFKEYRTVSIVNIKKINEFLNYLVNLELIDSSYSKIVDTRAKIQLFTERDTTTMCVGKLTLIMNGNIYKTPQGLIDYIEKLE